MSWAVGIYAKYYWQFLFHFGPKLLEVLFLKPQLLLIVIPEHLMVFRNRANLPLCIRFLGTFSTFSNIAIFGSSLSHC